MYYYGVKIVLRSICLSFNLSNLESVKIEFFLLAIVFSVSILSPISTFADSDIPNWIKQVAEFWITNQIHPQGRPVIHGWISSYFGKRTSPFSGKSEMHRGVDFAGKPGTDVIAVAGGVVTKASKNGGYGYLVEIEHGNGYVTRYGHNRELLVQAGEAIKRGQVIAKLGSTGRSTGPHVHFEVIKDGRRIDPMKFVQ